MSVGIPEPRPTWGPHRTWFWGGRDGGSRYGRPSSDGLVYDRTADTWRSTPELTDWLVSNPAVACGDRQMLVWGGRYVEGTRDDAGIGYLYDLETDAWIPIADAADAPSPRSDMPAVWTGTEFIVWGGHSTFVDGSVGDGAVFDPATTTWRPLSAVGAPAPRGSHSATWVSGKMVVFGGTDSGTGDLAEGGGIYDPATDTWAPLPAAGLPAPRFRHLAIAMDGRVAILGGVTAAPLEELSNQIANGAILDLGDGSWTPVSERGWRMVHNDMPGVWTGEQLVIRSTRLSFYTP